MDELIEDNRACLDQGIALLKRIDPDLYNRPCATCFDSAIGGHIRHNTDHFEQFLAGFESGRVDYDARTRDERVQTDPVFAISLMESLKAALGAIGEHALDRTVEVRMDGGSCSRWTVSSVRRELQFLISHTIHHYAMIVTIAMANGFNDFPEGFGIAPSTRKHRASQPDC